VRNWRVLTAIAAVVLAALAFVLVLKYTQDQKSNAEKPFKFKTVLVANGGIGENLTFANALNEKLIQRDTKYLSENVPPTAIDGNIDDATLIKRYGPLIAGHNIADGQPLVLSDFVAVGSASAGGISGTLSNDEKTVGKNNAQALAINLDDTHAVGGFLNPGDHINLIVSVPAYSDDTLKGSPSVKMTAYLLAGVKILAVGGNTATSSQAVATSSGSTTAAPAAGTSRNIITIEVNARQAEQIGQAGLVGGQMYATLMPATFKPGDLHAGDVQEIVNYDNLFDQQLTFTKGLLNTIKANG
jgi:Flp pilus assembly protein CpaB